MNLLKEVTVGIMRYYAVNTERKTSRMEDCELISEKSRCQPAPAVESRPERSRSPDHSEGNGKDPFRNHRDIHCRVYFL